MNQKPEYLISKGVVNLLLNRYRLDLSDQAKQDISRLEEEFTQRLGQELSDFFDYDVVSAETIDKTMEKSVKRSSRLPIIGLDDVYFRGIPTDGEISITRLVTDVNNFDNKVLGPRKGYASLEEQMELLEKDFVGKDVALMDVGVFEGETLLDKERGVINLMKNRNINVKRLYVSIMNSPALPKFKDAGIEIVTSNKLYDFSDGDWLEVRDLLALDGRKISTDKYDLNSNTQLFAKYIQDPQTLKTGANIQDGVTASIVLDLCSMYQKKLLREIRKDGFQVIEGYINSDPRLYTLEFRKKQEDALKKAA
ncbi:hypothetical protein KY349_03235 [Candidatus Woesearchaeota archaeon]|nr:hypothetical protein [Candidatus Woesearchaeota archaeon]